MAIKRIVWTETAARQRNIILQYWVERNKSNNYSLKLLELSNEKVRIIAKRPKMYRLSEFPKTRVASMGHFSIYYKINGDTVIVTAFWDNRQNPEKLLKELNKSQY
ncbi:MAG: type II toxin-antitoxin system RelE/ParE family toxin [Cyclobacteriaceae bacterium]|nr:type II toxin-antitoxin system RelE/ParE family toxin [Cyclobacteriaceae bacterium]